MIEEITGQIFQLFQANNILLFALLFVGIIIAYKLFQCALKAFMFGVIAASLPVIALFTNISLPGMFAEMSIITQVVWFGVFGVGAFFLYFFATHTLRTIRFVMSPFRRMFKEKPKTINKTNTIVVVKNDEDD
jgi:hypothetical protein